MPSGNCGFGGAKIGPRQCHGRNQSRAALRGLNPGNFLLHSVERPRSFRIDTGRKMCFREKTDRARGECARVIGKTDGGARFLHRDVPTEDRRIARAKRAENGRRQRRRIRIINYRDERFHARPDRQTNARARRPHAIGRGCDNAGYFSTR